MHGLTSSRLRRSILLAGVAALALVGAPAAKAQASSRCSVDALNALGVPDMTVTAATAVAAAGGAPAYCRVQGNVTTNGEGAGANQAGFQDDLPDFWNGKFLFLGGGGLDGSTALHDGTPQELAKGYATSSTNSGHTDSNGTFAITAPGVPNAPALVDYFYRSRHEVGNASKSLVLAYYGARRIRYSYFDGCSNGGRQGLMEATRYPGDYDGIVSGAPWMDPLGTELWSLKNVRALLEAYIPFSLFPQINAAIVQQCDAADGVKDGLIQNPARCAFRPDSLVPSVLTQAQADAIKTIIAPVLDADGRLIYPGSSVSDLFTDPSELAQDENNTPAPNPTSALPWGSPPLTATAGSPANFRLAFNIIAYLGLYDPSYDLNSDAFENKGVISTATRNLLYSRLALDIVDDPAGLARYLEQGKKILMFHGYSDPIISPYRTVLFYEDLAKLFGGYSQAQQYVRLFMAPGMAHCSGGPGPNVFGNGAEPQGYPADPQHDMLSALEDWVENGHAPQTIIATHYVNNDQTAATIDRTMPLCAFPAEARYQGSGDVNDAASWRCTSNTALLRTGPNGRQAGVLGPDNQPGFPPEVIH